MLLTVSRVRLLALLAWVPLSLHAAVTCTVTATPAIVRTEGIAERLGDIVLDCTGTPGQQTSGNLNVFLNTNITNHITSGSNVDVTLNVDTGTGPVSAGIPAMLVGAGQIAFNGLNVAVPASGRAVLRISNLRGNVQQFDPSGQRPIQANLSSSGQSFNLQQ